jgi:putative addiction module CopG family antidote
MSRKNARLLMDVLLKPELEKFVAEKVRSGQCADANDLINQALEVLRDQEELSPEHEANLRHELRRGVEQLDRGECASFDAERVIAEERGRLTDRKGR